MRVDTMDAFAQERDREVRGILQSINDLAQIMKDLSVLVIDQGTIVDRIDYNMEQARCPSQNPHRVLHRPPIASFTDPLSRPLTDPLSPIMHAQVKAGIRSR
jgi:hypothetical protein